MNTTNRRIIGISLPPDTVDAINREAARLKRPRSWIINVACRMICKQNQEPEMRRLAEQLALIASTNTGKTLTRKDKTK